MNTSIFPANVSTIFSRVPPFSLVTQTFSYTGADQTFLVPGGTTFLNVTLRGSGGARDNTGNNNGSRAGPGGLVSGALPVNGGETLTFIVGGVADTGSGTTYGGGGRGSQRANNSNGGRGGGRSAIRRGATELVTAGGGGGSGYGNPNVGGAGGGLTGGDGQTSGGYLEAWGLGGTQTAGGLLSDGATTTQGSQFQGGDGLSSKNFAGGGGGGYYGGAGGLGGSSGGAGSSFVANLIGTVVNTRGGGSPEDTAGSIIITYIRR